MYLNRDLVNDVKKQYPAGTRVELVSMDDMQAPPTGTLGTVRSVDDMCGIHIAWDNGSSLAAIYGVDIIRKV